MRVFSQDQEVKELRGGIPGVCRTSNSEDWRWDCGKRPFTHWKLKKPPSWAWVA